MSLNHVLLFVPFLLLYSQVLAQTDNPEQAISPKKVELKALGVSFGFRDMTGDLPPVPGNTLNFMDYLYRDAYGYSEYDYLSFSAQLALGSRWESHLHAGMYDNFAPVNLNFSVQHYVGGKGLGFSAGAYLYPLYLNGFTDYYQQSLPGFYTDVFAGYRQRTLYDMGLLAGPALRFHLRPLQVYLRLNGGMARFNGFSEKVLQKERNSNYWQELHFKARSPWAAIFFPEATVFARLFAWGDKTVGLRLYASWFTARRSIYYRQSVRAWTHDSPTVQEVQPSSRPFQKLETDFGLFLKW